MRRQIACFAVPACLFAAVAIAAAGEAGAGTGKTVESGPERKRPTSALRPRKNAPAEQLAWANSLRDAGRAAEAGREYRALVHTWHDSTEAPAAQFEYARLLEKKKDYASAFDEYEYLLRNYAAGYPYNDALDSQFRIANQVMTARSSLGFLSGSSPLDRALPMFEKIVQNGPRWEKTAQAQFNIGWIHERKEAFDEAVAAYENVRLNFPGSGLSADAAFRHGCCLYALAMRQPREERGLQVARSSLQRFLREFPGHEGVAEAKKKLGDAVSRLAAMTYERAVFYDKRAGRPGAALIAYGDFLAKFPDSAQAAAARSRVAELEARRNGSPAGGRGP